MKHAMSKRITKHKRRLLPKGHRRPFRTWRMPAGSSQAPPGGYAHLYTDALTDTIRLSIAPLTCIHMQGKVKAP